MTPSSPGPLTRPCGGIGRGFRPCQPKWPPTPGPGANRPTVSSGSGMTVLLRQTRMPVFSRRTSGGCSTSGSGQTGTTSGRRNSFTLASGHTQKPSGSTLRSGGRRSSTVSRGHPARRRRRLLSSPWSIGASVSWLLPKSSKTLRNTPKLRRLQTPSGLLHERRVQKMSATGLQGLQPAVKVDRSCRGASSA